MEVRLDHIEIHNGTLRPERRIPKVNVRHKVLPLNYGMSMPSPTRFILAPFLVLSTLGTLGTAAAQECVGIPDGRGLLVVGFEGRDGASGESLTFGYNFEAASILVQYRALDAFGFADDIRTSGAQLSLDLGTESLPFCITGGAEWMKFRDDWTESIRWEGTNPIHIIERRRIGAEYQRLRLPMGLALGRDFGIGLGLSLAPFVHPAVVFEHESYDAFDAEKETRSSLDLKTSGGLAISYRWLVIRSVLTHTFNDENSLSSLNNSPTISLQAGVRF